MRMPQSRKFAHGFLSGFVSSLGGNYAMGIENDGLKIMISAAIGGTAEALGGGKFANGAVTGAYVMMLNHILSHHQERARQELEVKVNEVVLAERKRAITNDALLKLNQSSQNQIMDAEGGLVYNINVDFDIVGLRCNKFILFDNINILAGNQSLTIDVYYLRSRASRVTEINWFKSQPAAYVSPGGPNLRGYLVEFRNQGNLTLGLLRFRNQNDFVIFRDYLSGK
jgi:hypothetical protein